MAEYLLGDRRAMTDLMAWNADGTRLPAKMHSQYLRRLYLNNDLSAGRYPVTGRPFQWETSLYRCFASALPRIILRLGARFPKLHLLSSAELTFVLTTGGHNGGIVSEPGRGKRQYQIHTARPVMDTWRRMSGKRRCRRIRIPGGPHGRRGCESVPVMLLPPLRC